MKSPKPKNIVKEHACGATYTEVPEDAKYWEFGTCEKTGEPIAQWLWQCRCKSHICFPVNQATVDAMEAQRAKQKEPVS